MDSWRDQILSEFIPGVSRLVLVADPDGLLPEEGILDGLRKRGFELIPFEDHVAFRYAYESRFRSRWDRGEETDLVVVLRSPASDLDVLPYDLLQAGRKLSFNLGDLFPRLSYPVVAALDRADLDALFDAQEKYAPGQLGDNATKEFVLRHVFEIAPELVKEPHDLLRVLLSRHYRGQRIPAILDERFIQVLRQNGQFEDWPLETVIPDAQAFFAFLQERWPVFLDSLSTQEGDVVREKAAEYGFEFKGPSLLPFDHDDVRVYIDTLFLEGLLQPVSHEPAEALTETWLAYGIKVSAKENHIRRTEGLLDTVGETLPTAGARYGEWTRFAYRWAELVALMLKSDAPSSEEVRKRFNILRASIDSALTDWAMKRYAGLTNLSPSPPVMLHHIPRFLAREIGADRDAKVAFLLIDGLSLDQWISVRDVLRQRDAHLRFHEDAVFAWIPTITSVSRQAAFAGQAPFYFLRDMKRTDREPKLWQRFWKNESKLTSREVAFEKGLGDGNMERVIELMEQPHLRVVGLVIDMVDKIMHGMELGAAGMHNQISQWVEQGFLNELITLLQGKGFQVYLSSDHGNVEATGCGRPAEGAIAELRGERARIYPDSLLRDRVKAEYPEALVWPSVGLPEDCYPLLAADRKAFVRDGERIVSHGGISIEELIVPLVRVERAE